jgi:YidC/Oxa1 family membrane protein insertase
MGSEQRNALLAVVLSGIILFGWQYFFAPPTPETAPIEPPQLTTDMATDAEIQGQRPAPIEPARVDQVFEISQNGYELQFSNHLGVLNLKNPQTVIQFENIVGVAKPLLVEFSFGGAFQRLPFERTGENTFVNAQHEITAQVNIDTNGVVQFQLQSPRDFTYRFNFQSEAKKLENGQTRYFALYTDELKHFDVGDDDTGDRNIKWAGIDFNYHLFAVYFTQPQTLLYKNTPNKIFQMYTTTNTQSLTYHMVFVKKELNYLSSLGHNLKWSVDFGIWGFFAVWILKGLQFFYTLIPNWGISIIFLTFLIRLLTFPLQYKSFVSMKKLQLVQPELTKIREKFKDDPQRMNKESMELFKRSGANPLGGCLPLLLQMPVFFAFYKVLNNSVELVDAPFVLWIQDLSNKDPFFVLPVLMTGAMFLQQKLTPNTISDPTQKKVMLFMPLIFGFIMKDLPSGLSLYIFVSTLFGIISQLLVFNSKKVKS